MEFLSIVEGCGYSIIIMTRIWLDYDMISEGRKSKNFSWGGHVPETPLAGALHAHTGKPPFKILDPPLIIKMTNGVNCTADNAC